MTLDHKSSPVALSILHSVSRAIESTSLLYSHDNVVWWFTSDTDSVQPTLLFIYMSAEDMGSVEVWPL